MKKRLLCIALLAWLSAATSQAEFLLDWKFEDPEGTPLSQLENQVPQEASFHADLDSSVTTGAGTFRIRRALNGTGIVFANLPRPLESGTAWLVMDIAGWNLVGIASEELFLGLYDSTHEDWEEDAPADVVAEVAMRRVPVDEQPDFRPREIRAEESAVGLRANPHHPQPGAEFTDPRVLFWSARREEPVRIVLKYDADHHSYEILFSENKTDYTSVARGPTDPDRTPRALRLRTLNAFSQPGEYLDIDRIFLSTEDPLSSGEILSLAIADNIPLPHLQRFEEMPALSARSWAVADAKTGKILFSHELEAPRKIASVTKTMAAYVVVQLIEEDPSILRESVTFSAAAVSARGSSTGLAAGESLPMLDALYSLMLPSGNDAGNALAEHFHDRLARPGTASASGSRRSNFVAEMNRQARKLGMTDSIFRIPFGDGGTADDHTSTARDLLLLGRATMEMPLLRQIVGTQTYTALVQDEDGNSAPRTWTNTNRFLGIVEGFDGIKTGTTTSAGACLLSSFRQEDRHYIFIILGSSSSNRRYLDTLSLLGWTLQGSE
jgi:serine-type D-Ala-D-Ala carboxypeptidase (penicillin-binding protein 5/6)